MDGYVYMITHCTVLTRNKLGGNLGICRKAMVNPEYVQSWINIDRTESAASAEGERGLAG